MPDHNHEEHPCNCYNNCNFFKDTEWGMECRSRGDQYGLTQCYVNMTIRNGCMSHPKAREEINKESIAEIERRISIVMQVPDDFAIGAKNYSEFAIKLMKEGVESG